MPSLVHQIREDILALPLPSGGEFDNHTKLLKSLYKQLTACIYFCRNEQMIQIDEREREETEKKLFNNLKSDTSIELLKNIYLAWHKNKLDEEAQMLFADAYYYYKLKLYRDYLLTIVQQIRSMNKDLFDAMSEYVRIMNEFLEKPRHEKKDQMLEVMKGAALLAEFYKRAENTVSSGKPDIETLKLPYNNLKKQANVLNKAGYNKAAAIVSGCGMAIISLVFLTVASSLMPPVLLGLFIADIALIAVFTYNFFQMTKKMESTKPQKALSKCANTIFDSTKDKIKERDNFKRFPNGMAARGYKANNSNKF